MGNSYMKNANLAESHGSRGFREYLQQDVSTGVCGLHHVMSFAINIHPHRAGREK